MQLNGEVSGYRLSALTLRDYKAYCFASQRYAVLDTQRRDASLPFLQIFYF